MISVNHLGGDLPVGDNLRSLSLITPGLEHVTTLILGCHVCVLCSGCARATGHFRVYVGSRCSSSIFGSRLEALLYLAQEDSLGLRRTRGSPRGFGL